MNDVVDTASELQGVLSRLRVVEEAVSPAAYPLDEAYQQSLVNDLRAIREEATELIQRLEKQAHGEPRRHPHRAEGERVTTRRDTEEADGDRA